MRRTLCHKARGAASGAEVAEWSRLAVWLDKSTDALESVDRMEVCGHNLAYRLSFVCSCLLLASKLKNQASLPQALQHALQIALPEGFGEALIDSCTRANEFPSATTLRRHQLSLHAGWGGRKICKSTSALPNQLPCLQ